jgi:hypothetical protein
VKHPLVAGELFLMCGGTLFFHFFAVDLNFFSDPKDRLVLENACKTAQDLVGWTRNKCLESWFPCVQLLPGPISFEWYHRLFAMTYFHICGTCPMVKTDGLTTHSKQSQSPEKTSAKRYFNVDERLRVLGIDDLRVADASVIPSYGISTSPISAIVMAIGIAAAEFIDADRTTKATNKVPQVNTTATEIIPPEKTPEALYTVTAHHSPTPVKSPLVMVPKSDALEQSSLVKEGNTYLADNSICEDADVTHTHETKQPETSPVWKEVDSDLKMRGDEETIPLKEDVSVTTNDVKRTWKMNLENDFVDADHTMLTKGTVAYGDHYDHDDGSIDTDHQDDGQSDSANHSLTNSSTKSKRKRNKKKKKNNKSCEDFSCDGQSLSTTS